MDDHTVKIEPAPEVESFLDQLTREGHLDNLINMLFGIVVISLVSASLTGILTYCAKRPIEKRQYSFDAFVYYDLARRMEM